MKSRPARNGRLVFDSLESRVLLSGVTIDLMALYTPAALAAAGSEAAMLQQFQGDVADANQAFANSQIDATLHLVHSELAAYLESDDLSIDLDRLQDTDDGYLDGIHATRFDVGADLVVLYTAPSDPYAGGIAYLLDDPASIHNHEWGFSVVVMPPDGPRYGLAHELGHNFGAGHDHLTSANGGAFDDSFGHRFTAEGTVYKTVMSYEPGTTIPYFSNPAVSYLGVPTGIPLGQAQAADNARTINLTAPIVANYRAQDDLAPGATLSAADITVGGSFYHQFTITYSDDSGILVSTLGDGDVIVTGPNGYSQAADFVSVDVNSNGAPRTATYRIEAPWRWAPTDNGTYTVSMAAGAVLDLGGNAVPAGAVGSFEANMPTLPNLAPYQPAGWSAPIVASTVAGTSVDAASFAPTQSIYLDLAVGNLNYGTQTTASFHFELLVDGVVKYDSNVMPGLLGNQYAYQFDLNIGKLSAGEHTLALRVDTNSSVAESSESDNLYSRTIVVASPLLTIDGGAADETFFISTSGGTVSVHKSTAGGAPVLVQSAALAGLAGITINADGGNDRLVVQDALPFVPVFNGGEGDDTFELANGAAMTLATDLSSWDDLRLVASGAGTVLTLGASQHVSSVTINDSATILMPAGQDRLLRAGDLSIGPDGTLDLADNSLVLDAPASPAAIGQLIARGRNGGAWDGTGIRTSAALAMQGLGWLVNDALGAALKGSFGGESVGSGSTLVGIAREGDLDLNGTVDGDDYYLMDAGFLAASAGTYEFGDVNYDGVTDGEDYHLADLSMLAQPEALFASAPIEPAELGIELDELLG